MGLHLRFADGRAGLAGVARLGAGVAAGQWPAARHRAAVQLGARPGVAPLRARVLPAGQGPAAGAVAGGRRVAGRSLRDSVRRAV